MPIHRTAILLCIVASLLFSVLLTACTSPSGFSVSSSSTGIAIVAAENFYGDIARHVGGTKVSVMSILNDPNVDPHQYESSVQTALAVARASVVIENGADYDTWMGRLLAASPNSRRIVIVASEIAPITLPDNPHVWYDVRNMQTVAQAINAALKKVDSGNAQTFDTNLQITIQSLNQITQKIDEIKGKYAQTPVGLTEDIYLYQAAPLGLNVLTPLAFQKAIAEGNDPPADTVITTTNQINQHLIKVLIYNEQTVTPITSNLQRAAQSQHIPIVSVTETMPSHKTYSQWMLDQLNQLKQALQNG
ncbi:MAG: zinc ABC transporter substrate-binding protein [Chloroflexota bacterium]|nr:zinc ABC transporter substrate-binding protein [Chloroflexota bacterium]